MRRPSVAAVVTAAFVYVFAAAASDVAADDKAPYGSLRQPERAAAADAGDRSDATVPPQPRRRPLEARDGRGPVAANQCVWVGKRIINLLMRDDAMGANDFMPFFTVFECSQSHLADAFGCVIANRALSDNSAVGDQIDSCWSDPAFRAPPAEESTAVDGEETPAVSEPAPDAAPPAESGAPK